MSVSTPVDHSIVHFYLLLHQSVKPPSLIAMSSDGMATSLNRPHTTFTVKVSEDVTPAPNNSVDRTLLGVNGGSLEDSNSSSLSDDEVRFACIAVAVFK